MLFFLFSFLTIGIPLPSEEPELSGELLRKDSLSYEEYCTYIKPLGVAAFDFGHIGIIDMYALGRQVAQELPRFIPSDGIDMYGYSERVKALTALHSFMLNQFVVLLRSYLNAQTDMMLQAYAKYKAGQEFNIEYGYFHTRVATLLQYWDVWWIVSYELREALRRYRSLRYGDEFAVDGSAYREFSALYSRWQLIEVGGRWLDP
jgi:hypothetical protein